MGLKTNGGIWGFKSVNIISKIWPDLPFLLMIFLAVQEEIEYDVILTTYNMVISSADDRVLFRKLDFHYVIFDEAHMLKNMASARYENLMRVQGKLFLQKMLLLNSYLAQLEFNFDFFFLAARKLLLTGTPLQNNLVELMSLLVFVMPEMFANKKEQLKRMFAMFPRTNDNDVRSKYEKDRIGKLDISIRNFSSNISFWLDIEHAKRIMKPFFLRRLKSEVLTALPQKQEQVIKVPMCQSQHELYFKMVAEYKRRAKDVRICNYFTSFVHTTLLF